MTFPPPNPVLSHAHKYAHTYMYPQTHSHLPAPRFVCFFPRVCHGLGMAEDPNGERFIEDAKNGRTEAVAAAMNITPSMVTYKDKEHVS